jgi:hypothetical protein
MNIVTPDTSGSIYFSVKTRPTASYSTFRVRMNWTNEETNASGSTIVTASYNSNDFLNVTASLYASESQFYKLQLIQLSGSIECNELYRGEILGTTQSATIRDSEPYYSYTGSNDVYILY